MSSPPPHVIFGTGAIGTALAHALRRRGEPVRLVNRSGRLPASLAAGGGVEVVAGDARDSAFTTRAAPAAGSCTRCSIRPTTAGRPSSPPSRRACSPPPRAPGPGWSAWRTSTSTGAPPAGRDRGPPAAAHTRKGRLRARMAEALLAAHAAGRVRVAIGRASDYFGPGGGAQSNLGDRVFPAALAGGTAQVLGDPDQPHTYTYIPDIAEALAVLGAHPEAPGEVWHLPNPETRTTRQIVETIYALAGRSRPRLRGMPTWLLRGVGLFNPTVRELVEMRYEFEEPFVVDSSKIERRLGLTATPLDEALARTLDTYRTGTP